MTDEAATEDGMANIPHQNSSVTLLINEDAPSLPQRTWPRFRESLRPPRVQFILLLLGCFSSWKSNKEDRKVAMYRSRQIAALHVLIHILPFSGAITLLILQWTSLWIGTQTNTSTVLQFAAKIHELTMQASLVEVLLCFVRREAVNGYVPLGALSGATHPMQLSYLWSLDYVSIFKSSALRGWRKLAFILVLPFLLLLTSLVGPSSAILMIPRPGTSLFFEDVTKYFRKSNEDLYPSILRGSNSLILNLEQYNATVLSKKLSRIHYPKANDYDRSSKAFIEYYARGCRYDGSQRLLLSSWDPQYPWEAPRINTATVPSCLSARNMHLPLVYEGSVNRTTSFTTTHPVVTTRCTETDLRISNNETRTDSSYDAKISYVHDDGKSLGALFDFRTLVNQISNYSGTSSAATGTRYAWALDGVFFPSIWTASPEPGSHSLIGVFSFWDRTIQTGEPPLSLSWPLTQSHTRTRQFELSVMVCTISAYWNIGELQLVEEFGVTELRTVAWTTSLPHKARPITLDISNIDALRSPEFIRDVIKIQPSFDGAISELLVLALSSIPSFDIEIEPHMPPNYNERDMTAIRYVTVLWGYGYGNQSTLVWLAMAVLTTYCLIIIAYIAYILITGSASTAWNSAIELVALALQSKKPDHLGNIGVGLDSIETFKEGVGIRVNQDNELELVFAHDRNVEKRGLRKIERNKEY